MKSLVANAVAVAHAAAAAVAGELMKYRRGDHECQVIATPCRQSSVDDGDDGAAMLSTLREFLIDPDELVLDGLKVQPAFDDLLIAEDGSTYIVVYGPGENCWRWSDQFHQRYRVHTVERAPLPQDEVEQE